MLVADRCETREHAVWGCRYDRGKIGPGITRRIADEQYDVSTGQAGQRFWRPRIHLDARNLLHDATAALSGSGANGHRDGDKERGVLPHERPVRRRIAPRGDEDAVGRGKLAGSKQELAPEVPELETAGRRGVVRDPLHRDEGARAIRRLA